jgi:hypothetical protein
MPTAYVSSGGMVAPRTRLGASDEIVTTMNMPMGPSAELGTQMGSSGNPDFSLKYQLSKDVSKDEHTSAATALGFLDLQGTGAGQAFYGVMSKKLDASAFVLHLGAVSPGSMFGSLRPFGGFEHPLTSRLMVLGEYDGLARGVNGGMEYHFTQNLATFVHVTDVGGDGTPAAQVAGFSFKMAF